MANRKTKGHMMDAKETKRPVAGPPGSPPQQAEPVLPAELTVDGQSAEAVAPAEKRAFKFPSTYFILAGLTVVVAALTWIIPAGVYRLDQHGEPIPGTYQTVPRNPQGLGAIVMAPINGMYGILSSPGPLDEHHRPIDVGAKGTSSVDNEGALYGAIGVGLFLLMIGPFITIVINTGAIAAGIGKVTQVLRGRESLLIPVLMVLLAIAGSTFGFSVETFAFYPIIIALMLGLGYDAMTAFATIALGAQLGVMASTINPFSTGIALEVAGTSLGDGLVLRLVLFVLLVGAGIVFVMRYARQVKASPSRSVLADQSEKYRREFLGAQAEEQAFPELTTRRALILAVFGLWFLILFYAVIPWDEIGVTWLPTLGWWFGQLSALFLVGTIVLGLIAGYGDEELVGTFLVGAKDFLPPALLIAMATGIGVLMHNGLIIDTILNALETLLGGTRSVVFAGLMYLINLVLAFFVPSSSGHAALAMPILAPIADFAHVPRSIVVTAFQTGNGTLNLFGPTSAIIMGALGVAKISYDRWLRFVWPFLLVVAGICILSVAIGALVGG